MYIAFQMMGPTRGTESKLLPDLPPVTVASTPREDTILKNSKPQSAKKEGEFKN
jgi:hypothetical protein